ncbi:MAG: PKD domain-containing protein [Candidatus Kapabacteria bacterium]|nr:PKD domain-containing protein [Candidatus Kapabacteria bacterium]
MRQGLLLASVVMAYKLVAQCLLYPVSLRERVAESELVVEGQLLREWVVEEPSRRMLYTVWELAVTKHFHGILPGPRLRIAQEGGILGDRAAVVEPSAPLRVGGVGLFFLQRLPALEPIEGQTHTLTAGPQGAILYELVEQKAYDPFAAYALPELYRELERLTGRPFREYAPLPQPRGPRKEGPGRPMATITGFTPSTISAGTFDTLRILGSGFGNTAGNIRFRNPDDGGSSWVSVPSNHIVQWTDMEIRVMVPTQAGTGTFQVITAANETVTSPSQITIPYALLTISSSGVRYPVRLVNHNGSGGYTLLPNANFASNTAAFQAFMRALQTWRCSTYVNFALSETTTNLTCSSDDGTNIVSFDATSCPLPSGVLGATYNYYAMCTSGGQQYWRRAGFDLIFRRTAPGGGWNFGPQPPGSTQYDFETVVLHELGHAHLLGHIIAAGQLMHYATGPGAAIRTPGEQTDRAGGLRVMQLSTASAPCGPGGMVPLTATTCIVGRPVAGFGAQPLQGCVPLTVAFSDSSNGAASWAWDVNGDGVTDYTTRNCIHTYQQPGQYTVRLIVSNSYGSDTLVRTNYITVYPLPVADAGPDRAVCPGESFRLGGTPTASGGTAPYQYAWEPATGLDDPTSANPTARLEASQQYVLTITDSRGCRVRDTVTIVVRPRPEPKLSVVGQTMFCEGDSVQLVAPVGYQRYRWNTGDTVRVLTVRRSGSYWVAAQDAFGCWGTSDTVAVTVYPLPQAQVAGPATACAGDSAAYRATVPQAGDWFEWTVLGGQLLRGQGMAEVLVRWTTSGTGRLLLRQRSQYGCEALSDTFRAVIYPLPQPAVTVVGRTVFCEGDSTVLEAPEGYLRYRWSTGDTTRRIVVRSAGTYRVEVVSAAGCRGSSDAVTIWVHPLPPKPGIERRGDTLICAQEAAAYCWYLNGQPIVGATQRRLVARLSGSYTVEITDSNGCRNMSDPLEVVVSVALQPGVAAPCFPNPVGDFLWIGLPEGAETVQVVLSDVLGRTVWSGAAQKMGKQYAAVPVQTLPAGVYAVRLSGWQERVVCYIVKY